MIQETLHRLSPVCSDTNMFVITGVAHATSIARQLPALEEDQIVIEPMARGTGPAIGLGVALAERRDPDAIVGSFAADHYVERPDAFVDTVRAAIEVAEQDYLVTIGIQPTFAETGYGYICAGDELGCYYNITSSRVEEFKEKPDLATAERYVASGQYLWNASMFVWKASFFMHEMRRLLPNVATALTTIVDDWDTPRREQTLAEIWPTIEDVTIDHGILERSNHVAVVPGSFGWSDLGDWHGVGKIIQNGNANGSENVVIDTHLLATDARNLVIFGNGRPIAVVGLDDIVVVDTDDALLVCNRSHAQQVKSIVDLLKQRGSTELI
jgi:mannose-1-phosphate guanylyltransferase